MAFDVDDHGAEGAQGGEVDRVGIGVSEGVAVASCGVGPPAEFAGSTDGGGNLSGVRGGEGLLVRRVFVGVFEDAGLAIGDAERRARRSYRAESLRS